MKVFFDTNVLVAASEQSHPHYTRARPLLKRVSEGEDKGYIGAHSIAELYASLTRLPLPRRIQPTEAAHIIRDNVLPHFETIVLHKEDYLAALKHMEDKGIGGARIYDFLLLLCAQRSAAERIYTFNLSDFRGLAPVELQPNICAP